MPGQSPDNRQSSIWNLLHLCRFRACIYQQKVTLSSGLSDGNSKQEQSARSASTGNLQIASPKSWWFCHRYRWQFAFHRDSTPPSWHCICEKLAHESTETRRKNLVENLTRPSARSPSTRKSAFWNLWHLHHFRACVYQLSHGHFKQEHNFLLFSSSIFIKKRTVPSGRSPGTRKSTWWNHLHFDAFRAFISQKKSHFQVAGLTDTQKETWLRC